MSELEQLITREFHRLYYSGGSGNEPIYRRTTWMGVPVMKCPLDLWIYQEILFELRPALIVETGTYLGGSALYLAHLCDLLGQGRIVTIDVAEAERPSHPRISYVRGSSADAELVELIFAQEAGAAPVLVVLDSDHSAPHVLRELELFAPRVTPGSYVIVEDTNVNGHPVEAAHGPGPFEAVQAFLGANRDFEMDVSKEKFLMTFNPRGFLRRRQSASQGARDSEFAEAGAPIATSPGDSGDVSASLASGLEQRLGERERELKVAAEGLQEAMRQLRLKDDSIAALQDQIAQISRGFEEAVRQIHEKDKVINTLQAGAAGRRD